MRDENTGKVLYFRPLNKCQEGAFSVIFNNLSDKMDKQRFDKINNRPVWGQAGDPPNVLFSNIGRQSISEQIRQAVWLSDFMLEPRFWPRFIIFRFKIIYRLMVNTHLHNKNFWYFAKLSKFSSFWRPYVTWRRWTIWILWKWFKVIQNYQKVKWSKDFTDFVPKSRSFNDYWIDFEDDYFMIWTYRMDRAQNFQILYSDLDSEGLNHWK